MLTCWLSFSLEFLWNPSWLDFSLVLWVEFELIGFGFISYVVSICWWLEFILVIWYVYIILVLWYVLVIAFGIATSGVGFSYSQLGDSCCILSSIRLELAYFLRGLALLIAMVWQHLVDRLNVWYLLGFKPLVHTCCKHGLSWTTPHFPKIHLVNTQDSSMTWGFHKWELGNRTSIFTTKLHELEHQYVSQNEIIMENLV